ncbi:MAG: T9SS type B sorting domain-containing protein [Flavobacteriales bacterium]
MAKTIEVSFILVLLGLSGIFSTATSQTDTEFWFVAPEVWAGHGDSPIVVRFATLDEAANITIDQPANLAFPAQNISLPANGTQTFNLTPWITMVENKPVNTILEYGLRITSDAPITAYYEVNHIDNPDIFTLKGHSALGTEFYTPFQSYLSNNYTQSKAAIDIVATEPNTEVTIVPSVDLVGHDAGIPFTVSLNLGETYGLRAASVNAALHPGGTHITSNHPIAVTMSDDSIVGSPYGGSCFDLLGDQLIPVSVAGDEYIAVKGTQLGGSDRVYLLATEDNTEIFINGISVWTLNAGETYSHTLSGAVAYYESSAPMTVLHMTGVGCEVAGAILPPLRCTGSQEVAFVRSTNASFSINILVQSGSEGDFSFNGNTGFIAAADFFDVPGAVGVWKYAQITTTAFVPTLAPSRLENSSGYFHMGVINGTPSGYCRYGYFSDFAEYAFETFTTDDNLCSGEMATISANPITDATYTWTGPNGFESFENENEIGPVDPSFEGMYIVSGEVGECPIVADTLVLNVQPYAAAPDLNWNAPTCEGDDLILESPSEGAEWIWTGPDGALANSDSILVISNADPTADGPYSVSSLLNGCPSEETTLDISITATFEVELISVFESYCEGSDWSMLPDQALSNGNWIWELPDGTTVSGELLELNGVTPSDGGWYVLGGNAGGCVLAPDSIELEVFAPVNFAFDIPTTLCSLDDPIAIGVNDPDPGIWSASCGNCIDPNSGVFDPTASTAGTFEITYESLGICAQTFSESIEVLETPNTSFNSPITACEGAGDVQLTADNPLGTWTSACTSCITEDGLFNTESAGAGTWEITYAMGGNCPASSSGIFEVTDNVSSAFEAVATSCVNDAIQEFTPDVAGGEWSSDCGACISNSGGFSPALAGIGGHTVTYTIPGACGTTTSLPTTVYSLPDASFTTAPTSGCVPLFIELTAPTSTNAATCQWGLIDGSGGSQWMEDCGDSFMVIEAPGCYDVIHTVTDANGCTNSSLIQTAICGNEPPSSAFVYSPAHPSVYDPIITAWAIDSLESNTFQWTIDELDFGSDHRTQLNLTEIYSNPFNLCLQVSDDVGCATSTCKTIVMSEGISAYAPNAFTPDQDGTNDAWRIVCGGDVQSLELRIFDRWGRLVFETVEIEHWWVGDVQGGRYFAADGVYLWEAILRDDQFGVRYIQGHVTLIR